MIPNQRHMDECMFARLACTDQTTGRDAAKYMKASDCTFTYTTPTSYDCSASAYCAAGSSQTIFPYQYSTTSTLLADCQEAFDQAAFQPPSQFLLQTNVINGLRGIRSVYLSMGTGTDEGKSSERYFRERWEMRVQAVPPWLSTDLPDQNASARCPRL
jgi:hypothetical protein